MDKYEEILQKMSQMSQVNRVPFARGTGISVSARIAYLQ
jgi:hypothetical protein